MDAKQLITDYQTAMVNAATSQAAASVAAASEDSLLQHLDVMSSGRFLQPTAIADSDRADITQASLDAHFKKIQAQQMQSMSDAQLQQLSVQDQQQFHGKKVRVTLRSQLPGVIELVTFDQQSGYRTHAVSRQSITGVIETVRLDRNMLILRPTMAARLLNSRLQQYVVYVIDPETFMPLVSVTIR